MAPFSRDLDNADIAVIGMPFEKSAPMNASHKYGPKVLRELSKNFMGTTEPWINGEFDIPFDFANIIDYGTIDTYGQFDLAGEMEHALEHYREIVCDNHIVPFMWGGDHTVSVAPLMTLGETWGPLSVIHFDAHYDAGSNHYGHHITHGTPVRNLLEDGFVDGKNFIQVALRGYYPDEESFKWMRKQGFRYHTMAEVEERGFDAVMEDVIKEANEGPEYLFVSFDIDTLDPAFVPGTGTPEPGGLTPREAFPIVRRLCAESNVVGFELVELNPLVDPTYVSALNANRIIKEALTGMAMRKLGLTDPHYLSPLTKTHGQGE